MLDNVCNLVAKVRPNYLLRWGLVGALAATMVAVYDCYTNDDVIIDVDILEE